MSKTRELYAPSNFDGQEPMEPIHDMPVTWFVSAAQDVDWEHHQGVWEDWQRELLDECISSPISNEELYKKMRKEMKQGGDWGDGSMLLDEAWADYEKHILQQEELQYSQPENEKPRG